MAKGKREAMRELLHGGGVRAAAAALGVPEGEILDFSSNLNPLGPPPEVIKLLEEEGILLKEATTHPPEYPFELEKALAAHWKVDEENLAVIPGSVYGIYLIFQLLRPEKTVMHVPTFSEYSRAAQAVGSEIVAHKTSKERGFRLCLGEYSWRIEPGIQVAVLCNPNNPTGYLMPLDEVDALARWCDREGCYLLVDEAFVEFTSQGSAVDLVREHSHLVVLRSFTKAFAIPGLRVGAVVGPEALMKRVKESTPPWSISGIGQKACMLALNCQGYLEKTRALVKEERERLRRDLSGLGLIPVPSWANYLLLQLPQGLTGENLQSRLLKHKILIRCCDNIPGLDHRYIRISVRRSEENQQLLSTLQGCTKG